MVSDRVKGAKVTDDKNLAKAAGFLVKFWSRFTTHHQEDAGGKVGCIGNSQLAPVAQVDRATDS